MLHTTRINATGAAGYRRPSAAIAIQRRMASGVPPSSATPSAQGGRSPALPAALALAAVVAGVMFFNQSKTGSPDNIGKAMAKTATPANSDGGLGRMDADPNRPLQMGGAEKVDPNPRSPTRKE